MAKPMGVITRGREEYAMRLLTEPSGEGGSCMGGGVGRSKCEGVGGGGNGMGARGSGGGDSGPTVAPLRGVLCERRLFLERVDSSRSRA